MDHVTKRFYSQYMADPIRLLCLKIALVRLFARIQRAVVVPQASGLILELCSMLTRLFALLVGSALAAAQAPTFGSQYTGDVSTKYNTYEPWTMRGNVATMHGTHLWDSDDAGHILW